jgi:hypothetical protein
LAGGIVYSPQGSLRDLQGFGSCERQFWRREPKEPKIMPTCSIEASQNLESAAPKKGKTKPRAPSRREALPHAANSKKPLRTVEPKAACIAAAKTAAKAQEPSGERITKQELCSHF